MKQTKLIKYLREEDGTPRGVVLAIRNEEEVNYGFSLCHSKKDKWDKEQGIKIAEHRAFAGDYNLPQSTETRKLVLDGFKHLSRRAVKYFKDLPFESVAFVVEEPTEDQEPEEYGN